ncbi:MAG: hypothetical protein JNN01_20035 [Opitutaceae bacterium]|nr:hypothetical protein [Opitutaceae bacterium]
MRTVEWLMRNGEGLRDKITVEGVVRQVSAKARALALIDVQEFRECGLKACAEYELPVRWQGAMPAVGRGVRASGFVEKARGKLVFVARSIEAFDVPATEAK